MRTFYTGFLDGLQARFVHMQFCAGKPTCLLRLAHKQRCLRVQKLLEFGTLFSAGKQQLKPLWLWWVVDRAHMLSLTMQCKVR